jgi:hypothetical protein
MILLSEVRILWKSLSHQKNLDDKECKYQKMLSGLKCSALWNSMEESGTRISSFRNVLYSYHTVHDQNNNF